MAFDREQTVEQAARAEWAVVWPGIPYIEQAGGFEEGTAAALPVIVRAVTDEIRALHRPINTRVYTEQDCRDRMCEDHDDLLSGANYCPSYLLQTCAECRLYGDEDEDDEPYPCPTVRLCDEIDVAAGVER